MTFKTILYMTQTDHSLTIKYRVFKKEGHKVVTRRKKAISGPTLYWSCCQVLDIWLWYPKFKKLYFVSFFLEHTVIKIDSFSDILRRSYEDRIDVETRPNFIIIMWRQPRARPSVGFVLLPRISFLHSSLACRPA